jgi:serine/threonine protein kinase
MADYEYDVSTRESEVLNRPAKANEVSGQAQFFAFALALGVPILSSTAAMVTGTDPIGVGAAFQVVNSATKLSENTVNPADEAAWLSDGENIIPDLEPSQYVIKRIGTTSTPNISDTEQLAEMVNEVRILATESIRKCESIVRLIYMCWDESPVLGRYWPQLLLEKAHYGNLANYIRTVQISTTDKLHLGLQILRGLGILHSHDIVHCDLKMENILIFSARESSDITSIENSLQVIAKLCDFGTAVILSDYTSPDEDMFQGRLGTFPWSSPELTFGISIMLAQLPLTDMYSFGLIMSSMFLGGRSPFGGMNEVDIQKLIWPPEEEFKYTHLFSTVRDEVLLVIGAGHVRRGCIEALLRETLQYLPQQRKSLRFTKMRMEQELGVAKYLENNPG